MSDSEWEEGGGAGEDFGTDDEDSAAPAGSYEAFGLRLPTSQEPATELGSGFMSLIALILIVFFAFFIFG